MKFNSLFCEEHLVGNELMTFDLTQLPSTQLGSDEAYAELSRGGDFLKYVKLYTKGADIDRGRIPPGHWGIPEAGNEEIVDLGDSITVLPLARRPKALDTSDKSAIVVSYDEQSDEFKRIAAQSMVKESGCQHGVSFLVLEKSTGQFLEVYFGNKSSRPEAKKLFPFLPLAQADIDRRAAAGADVTGLEPHDPMPVTLKVRLAENKRNQSWHVPMAVKSSAPFGKTPSTAIVVREITKFLTVKSGGTEKVAEPARKERAR
jgi:hypothetical protein